METERRMPPPSAGDELIIDELRLEGADAYGSASVAALLRRLAAREAGRQRMTISPVAMRATLRRMRPRSGCSRRPSSRAGWRATVGCSEGLNG